MGIGVDPSHRAYVDRKHNGKDLNSHNTMKYCQNLRLAGLSDWRLATIDELWRIYDGSALEVPGRLGNWDALTPGT